MKKLFAILAVTIMASAAHADVKCVHSVTGEIAYFQYSCPVGWYYAY